MVAVTVHDVTTPSGSISYHRIGHGPHVLLAPNKAMYGTAQSMASQDVASYLEAIARFATFVWFDRRGIGWSDPLTEELSNEQCCRDMITVMDHACVDTAVVVAMGYDAQPPIAFAATHPDRTSGLVCVNTTAKLARSPDHPSGMAAEVIERWHSAITPDTTDVDMFSEVAPSRVGDAPRSRWFHAAGRNSVSPVTARRYLEFAVANDVRGHLPAISAPTLVAHTRDNTFVSVDEARLLVRSIPGAALHELDGTDQMLSATQLLQIAALIERLVTGRSGRRRPTDARVGLVAATSSELRVAALVCEGLTNREIADRLTVSPSTVKSHVESLLRKTGTSSRTALAVYMAGNRAST